MRVLDWCEHGEGHIVELPASEMLAQLTSLSVGTLSRLVEPYEGWVSLTWSSPERGHAHFAYSKLRCQCGHAHAGIDKQ